MRRLRKRQQRSVLATVRDRDHPELLQHAEVVSIRCMMRDFAVVNLVPVNVLHLEASTRWRNIHQQRTIDWTGSHAFVGPADAATHDD